MQDARERLRPCRISADLRPPGVSAPPSSKPPPTARGEAFDASLGPENKLAPPELQILLADSLIALRRILENARSRCSKPSSAKTIRTRRPGSLLTRIAAAGRYQRCQQGS